LSKAVEYLVVSLRLNVDSRTLSDGWSGAVCNCLLLLMGHAYWVTDCVSLCLLGIVLCVELSTEERHTSLTPLHRIFHQFLPVTPVSDQLRLQQIVMRCNNVILYLSWYFVVMAALWNRASHYIFALWFLSSIYLFFSRLMSAVGHWKFTILPHMVWPWCEFRMHVWNVLHAPRWKYRTQKIAILAPSHNIVGLYLRTWGMYRQSEKIVKCRYLLHTFS